MNFPELTQAFLRHDSNSIIEFVQDNQTKIKLLFLKAHEDAETQKLVTDSFLAAHQRNYSAEVKNSDEFQALVNQFALYFKRVERIPLIAACRHLCILPSFKSRIDSFIFTRQYNDVNQHIDRFSEYLNLISEATDSEDRDFITEVADDIAEYCLYAKEQLSSYGELGRLHEFEALFEDKGLIRQYPILSVVLPKLLHKISDLPVRSLSDKIYEPTRFSEHFFERKIVSPIRLHPRTIWHTVLLGFSKNEIRYDIIELGQANFDKEYAGVLTGKDIVMLYCYFNMRKHYFTSLSMFERLDNLLNIYRSTKRIKFIDIGCGPATSGIALVDYINSKTDSPVLLDYFGIDIYASMRDTGADFMKNEIVDNRSRIRLMEGFNDLNFEELQDGSCILINTCYLFASPSLDVEQLATLVNKVRSQNTAVLKYLLFQNPSDKEKSRKYFQFKELIAPFEVTYSEVDTIYYNNKRNSPYEPTREHVFYELIKL